MDESQPLQQLIQQPTQTKSRKNPFKIITVILLIVTLSLVGFIVFQEINRPSEEKSDTNSQTNNSENVSTDNSITNIDKDSAVRDVIDVIKEDAEDFMTTQMPGGGTSVRPFTKIYDENRPAYKPESAKSGLYLEKSYGLYMNIPSSIYTSDDEDKLLNEDGLSQVIKNKLSSMGFAPYTDYSIFGGIQYINTTTNIVCGFAPTIPFYLSCSDTSWFSEQTKNLVNDLAEAYKEKKSDYPSVISINTAGVENSTVTPYQTITASFGNAASLFYRVDENSKWVYFTSTQQNVSCDEYNSQDLKNAFAGDDCYSQSSNATIKVQP